MFDASNFKTELPKPETRSPAELLKDEAWVREALTRTAEHLRTIKGTKLARSFNMDQTCASPVDCDDVETKPFQCGAAACIGGHAYLLGLGLWLGAAIPQEQTDRASEFVAQMDRHWSFGLAGRGNYDLMPRYLQRLSNLFYPPGLSGYWEDIKPSEALKAIENYLNTDRIDPWDGVFKDNLIPRRERVTNAT